MPNYNLLDLENVLRKIGRGVAMYAHDGNGVPVRWDRNSPINLAHLGDTQGEIVINPNSTVATLTLEEISGDAVHEAEAVGENPVLEIPLYLADPDLYPIVSPTGHAGAGHIRTRPVAERTIVIFPERLFRREDNTYGSITFNTGTGWRMGDDPFEDDKNALLGHSFWLWRAYFTRPPRRFRGGHGNDAKNIETVTCQGMMHPSMPDGQRLYTVGDPSSKGINLDPAVS